MANRKVYPRLFSGMVPYYIVNEFPKSGGTWVGHMLSDALVRPFPRHQPLRLQSAIVHGHFKSPLGLRNVLVVWRDPRDVFVSYYYHCYFVNEYKNRKLVKLMKSRLPFGDYEDIRGNLPTFIRFMHETPLAPRFTWADFAESWTGRAGAVHTRYEELRENGPDELARIVRALTGGELEPDRAAAICEGRSFARAKAEAATRAAARGGVERSFIREGSMGGWRRHFSDEALELAERYCGTMMARLGYT